MNELKGVDVSKWDGTIDFEQVKNAGVDFVIIRAGYGKNGTIDPYFERNYRLAKKYGLHVGAYWYSYAESVTDAKKEADGFKRALAGKQFDFPVYYDVEENKQFRKGKTFINKIIKAFCTRLEKSGYYVGVYMSTSYAHEYLSDATRKAFDLWVAQYNTRCTYRYDYKIWQYTSKGRVAGINCDCDLNKGYYNYPDLIVSRGFNGYGEK